jgi:hypothetical protein
MMKYWVMAWKQGEIRKSRTAQLRFALVKGCGTQLQLQIRNVVKGAPPATQRQLPIKNVAKNAPPARLFDHRTFS